MAKTENADAVLAFWFEEISPEQWFKKDDVFDETIKNRFEPTIISSLKGERDSWANTATGCLALIILLDQFTRNIYRNTPRAFSGDEMALALSLRCLERGYLDDADANQRHFMLMPLKIWLFRTCHCRCLRHTQMREHWTMLSNTGTSLHGLSGFPIATPFWGAVTHPRKLSF